jgi:hypothetical protein
MRMRSLYLTSTLIAAAIPLSAGATAAAAEPYQSATSVGQYASALNTCPAGSVWEPAGYMGNGHWRPEHCAPRNDVIP